MMNMRDMDMMDLREKYVISIYVLHQEENNNNNKLSGQNKGRISKFYIYNYNYYKKY